MTFENNNVLQLAFIDNNLLHSLVISLKKYKFIVRFLRTLIQLKYKLQQMLDLIDLICKTLKAYQ
jgi:hypothetical protein